MVNQEYLKFFGIGDIYEIKHSIDIPRVIEYCNNAEFKDRGKGIHSLSLTSIDGTLETTVDGGLKYIDGLKDDGIRVPTIHYHNLKQHISLLCDLESVICRTRIFKALPCGVWEPHRDGSSTVRIMVPLMNSNWKNFRLMYEDRVLNLHEGKAYVVNTLKEHAGVAFTDEMYIMVLTILPNAESAKILTKLLDIK